MQGDYGEGGGAIVRLSAALSALTGKPVKITNIRAKRCSPGLREQHKRGILAVAELCNAETKNVEVGSTEIEFIPGKIKKNAVHVNIGTAGSVGLVLQALLLPCFKADKEVRIEIKGGGTLGLWSPNVLYTKHVLFPMIEKLGFKAEMDVKRHGFFPRGGAEVSVKTHPAKEKELNIEKRGELLKVKGISLSSAGLKKREVAER
ncbi:MAG: RNA 3'-phosphate cyclase, partial [Thermodesulfobacteriota bacterium]